MEHKFQINLGGIIDLLSNHLYSSPSVYLRELLQNGVDAIRARQGIDPDHRGLVEIERAQADTGRPMLVFRDNGIGLTEDETHRFLSTIGESSKRDDLFARSSDFIGQFGIGLLSCFVVSDEIVMVTRSARKGAPAVEWRGRADGTYTISEAHGDVPVGTTVYLSCKPDCEEWFEPDRVKRLVTQFGGLLPFEVVVSGERGRETINAEPPPWRCEFPTRSAERQAYMRFGREAFGGEFLDFIPLRSEVGGVIGAAYVLPYTPNPTARRAHRVYLKNMLLSEASDNLLPSWAFFVTCVVNTDELRPTASRESFYEDEVLARTREALGETLRRYLVDLRDSDPDTLHNLIALHFRAIKALAVHDDEFFSLFVDWLPFETSLGRMTLGEYRESNSTVHYVTSVDTFRQIAQVAASQGIGVINAGYSYDSDLIEKLPYVFDDVGIERIDSTDLAETFEDLSLDEREDVFQLIKIGDIVLQAFKCRAEVKRYTPVDLPALFLAGDDVNFMRSVERSKDVADEHWSAILTNLAPGRGDAYAELCFNYNNPLVRRLARLEDREVLRLAIQMLYVQSLLLGHHPLNAREMTLLNTGLIDLIELSIGPTDGGGWVQ